MTPKDENYTLDFESLVWVSRLYNSYLTGKSNSEDVLVCDIDENIPGTVDYFYDDCHFNVNGAQKVGFLLTECISPFIK